MKYIGRLELQIFDREIKEYIRWEFCPPDPRVAREIAAGRPWRICKRDRPLKPEMKNHYKEWEYKGRYARAEKYEYLGLS